MKLILIYTTFPNIDEAKKIVSHLLDEKIIACANIFPVNSFYRWNGKVENQDELVAILKTRSENWQKVKDYIETNHSYDIPCVIKFSETEAGEDYLSWIENETEV